MGNRNTTAQNQQVSQPNANTNVVGIPFKSREIKFRAWDGNRIRDIFKILITEADGLIIYFKSTESGKEPGHLIERDSRLKLMQYTGLKDKKGKEIYEGDIMCWDKYQNTRHDVRWVVEIIPTRPTKSWSQSNNKEDAIVIGNIFENPELLETLR